MHSEATANSRRLARQIIDLIYEARFEPGHHLREQQLADAFGVSRTPIRAGLSLLTSLGVVEARRNQGFFLLRSAEELQKISIEVPASNDQQLYKQLVKDRIAGILPESLTQSEILQRYHAERGVLARTLLRLSEDGLIERSPGHGWRFQQTLNNNVALANSYGFRLMLEPASLRSPDFKADRQSLKRLRSQHLYLIAHQDITQVKSRHIFDTDALFHESLAEWSGNIFVLQAVQQQNRLRRLLEFASYHNRQRVREWCEEHVAILDALRQGQMSAAAEMMYRHLLSACATAAGK